VQYRVVFADKSVHWLEARGRTIVIAGTPVRMLGVAMDVTARKLAEETLRHSEKIAATGRLAASIAHEINNPLAAVMNALYILRTSPRWRRRFGLRKDGGIGTGAGGPYYPADPGLLSRNLIAGDEFRPAVV